MQKADEQTLAFLQELRKVSFFVLHFNALHMDPHFSHLNYGRAWLITGSPCTDSPLYLQYVKVGIVGGSDLFKICDSLGANGEQPLYAMVRHATPHHSSKTELRIDTAVQEYDYLFAENGLVAYKGGKLEATASLKSFLGEDKLKELINFLLHYIADLDIPIKRGTFIEFRNGMLNVSPIGRNCSQSERDEFERYDKEANVRYN